MVIFMNFFYETIMKRLDCFSEFFFYEWIMKRLDHFSEFGNELWKDMMILVRFLKNEL